MEFKTTSVSPLFIDKQIDQMFAMEVGEDLTKIRKELRIKEKRITKEALRFYNYYLETGQLLLQTPIYVQRMPFRGEVMFGEKQTKKHKNGKTIIKLMGTEEYPKSNFALTINPHDRIKGTDSVGHYAEEHYTIDGATKISIIFLGREIQPYLAHLLQDIGYLFVREDEIINHFGEISDD